MKLAQEYDEWHQRVMASSAQDLDERSPWYHLVLEYLAPVEGKKVLEVACGRGGFVRLLASRGAWVCGADFSIAALGMGLRKMGMGNGADARASLTQADAHHLPYADASFDVIVSCETIEHLVDPLAAVREMARVCRTGGLLYLTTPNYANLLGLYELYARLRRRKRESEFAQPLDRRSIFLETRRMLRQAGWEILDSDGTVHQVVLPKRNPVRVGFLERKRWVRRWLSPLALHYLLIGRKRGML